jgi:hypothetical protein
MSDNRYFTETVAHITHVMDRDAESVKLDTIVVSFHGDEGKRHAEVITATANENRAERCPRCGHLIPNDDMGGVYCGALSRRDNETEICSECGQREAFEDMGMEFWLNEPYWNVAHEIS